MITITKVNWNPFAHSCKIKGCLFKKRNGRCSLGVIHFVIDPDGTTNYSKCLDFKEVKIGE